VEQLQLASLPPVKLGLTSCSPPLRGGGGPGAPGPPHHTSIPPPRATSIPPHPTQPPPRQVNQLLEVGDKAAGSGKYSAMSKWAGQLASIHATVSNKLA
jgi:hypothetical protein